jgi:hypothetical protein
MWMENAKRQALAVQFIGISREDGFVNTFCIRKRVLPVNLRKEPWLHIQRIQASTERSCGTALVMTRSRCLSRITDSYIICLDQTNH